MTVSGGTTEIELKIGLASKEDWIRLGDHLGKPLQIRAQGNAFFETEQTPRTPQRKTRGQFQSRSHHFWSATGPGASNFIFERIAVMSQPVSEANDCASFSQRSGSDFR